MEKNKINSPLPLHPVSAAQKPKPVLESASAAARRGRRRKLAGLVLVFFLLTVILSVVPVRLIPGLRYLAVRMGWSAEAEPSFSFARALLTWTIDGDARRSEGEFSIFNRSAKAGRNASGPRSGLFNLRKVNASRRAQGLPEDSLAVYTGLEDNAAAVSRPVNGWSWEAQRAAAQREKKTDVFLGEDASVMARAASQAADQTKGSANSLRLLPKAQLKSVGGGNSDWLGRITDKASMHRLKELDETTAKLQRGNSSSLTVLGGGFAEKDSRRELSTIWILSDAADKKAKQPMLKKQLASAGYMAMEMPKKVFDSFGFGSGVRLDGAEMVMNFESEEERIKKEKECRNKAETASGDLQKVYESSVEKVQVIRSTIPDKCEADFNSWKGVIKEVEISCNEAKNVLKPMIEGCGVKLAKKGSCSSSLPERADEAQTACAAWKEAKKQCEDKEAAGEICTDEEKAQVRELEREKDNAFLNLTTDEVDSQFNIGEHSSGTGDFFPESDPLNSL